MNIGERRTCLDGFAERVERSFSNGGTLSDALGYANRFRKHDRATELDHPFLHRVAVAGGVGLFAVILIEYLRSKGVDLPRAVEVIAFSPVASGSTKDDEDKYDYRNDLRYMDERGEVQIAGTTDSGRDATWAEIEDSVFHDLWES